MPSATTLAAVIAHRGASADAPENTIAAIRLAAEQGAKAVEIDVSISADGVAYVHHDDTLNRCTNGSGYLCAHSADELDAIQAGILFKGYDKEPLPRLTALLDCVQELGMALNLEIKPTPGLEEPTAEIVCKTIATHWRGENTLLYSSFSREALATAKHQQPEIPRALIVCAIPSNWSEQLQAFECSNLHFAAPLADKEIVQSISKKGYGLYCFTVNDIDEAKTLLDYGIDGVFSDCPGKLIASL